VPHHKIKEILRTASPDELQVAAFLRGYGLSPKELATMARELRVLGALREIDTLRWEIEKQPGMIASLGERARRAVANLDQVRRLRGRIRVAPRSHGIGWGGRGWPLSGLRVLDRGPYQGATPMVVRLVLAVEMTP
jgi:hypothetical protein